VAGREPTQKDSRSIRRSAVCRRPHEGDIHGAFGTIRVGDVNPRRTWRRRLLTLAAIVGPGAHRHGRRQRRGWRLHLRAGGQDFGYSLLWTLLLLIPVLIVNQEMVVRLGAVTGVGYARLIKERFGGFWGWFSVGGIFLLNFLTISTEFIGISLAGAYFGFSLFSSSAWRAGAGRHHVSGNFRRWERAMFRVPVREPAGHPTRVVEPSRSGGGGKRLPPAGDPGRPDSTRRSLIIAVVGTTVAPWQLFFQQSNVIDKRITPRWLDYEKADTVLGAFVVVVGALHHDGLSVRVHGHPDFGHFTDALGIASGLASHIHPVVGSIFRALAFRRLDCRRVSRHPRDLVCIR